MGKVYLDNISVQLSPDLELVGILDSVGRHNARPVGCPAIKALAEGPLTTPVLDLPVSMRHVVANTVPENMIESILLRHIRTPLSNHNDKLTLPVQSGTFLGNGMNRDGVSGTRQRCLGLVKEYGKLGLGHIRLLGMESVVEAKASHGADVGEGERRQQRTDGNDLICDFVLAEDITRNNASRLCLGDVAHALTEDGIAVVSLAVFGQEADEALWSVLAMEIVDYR